MYCSKGMCEGLCTTVRVHVRVCVPAQNPFTYLHCTPHPHTSQLHLIHALSLTALHYTHTHTHCTPPTHTHCTPPTHSPSLFRLPTSQTHILLHCRYKGQKTPLNFVHLNLSVVLFLALCVFVGGGWYLRKFEVRTCVRVRACVCVCVCACVRACVCVCVEIMLHSIQLIGGDVQE